MKIDKLGLQIASTIEIQLLGEDTKWYPVKLIGYQAGDSIIISAPRSAGSELSMILKEDQPLDVRLKTAKYAVSFRSQIIEKRLTPYSLIHISVPSDIDDVKPIKAEIIKIKQDVTLINDDNDSHSAKVEMTGISFTEATVKHQDSVALEGQRVTLTMSFVFTGKRNVIVLEGHISTVTEDAISKEKLMTLVYDELDEPDQILLHAYIYERMLINMNIIAEHRN